MTEGIRAYVAKRATSPDDERETDERSATALYSCGNCERTYITEGMTDCPRCGEAVDREPSFAELGLAVDR
ncbi:hypothetical protein [Halovivax cerinus]|uniref:Small CPxCG-related zinc finger protein n=1 Tax=Halovivax cerinus TaxID=1487865 RepID=A0ABD5NSB1_9EURY|nr:hypothetical protein [Halovivax cerinus]